MDTVIRGNISSDGDSKITEYLIILSVDRSEKGKIIPIDSLSWIMTDYISGDVLIEKEEVFSDDILKHSISDIATFTNTIFDIQDRYHYFETSHRQNSFVVMSDKESALLLLQCFVQLGLRLPAFLFRVYLLSTEFDLYLKRDNTQYPVAASTDFYLRVCNGRDPAVRGMSRCIDLQQALLSLTKKGHILCPSSLFLLCNETNACVPSSVDTSRRHLSLDATADDGCCSCGPLHRDNDTYSSLSPWIVGGHPSRGSRSRDGSTLFSSLTPLFHTAPLSERRRLSSTDGIPELTLPSHAEDTCRHDDNWSTDRGLFTYNAEDASQTSFVSTLPSAFVTSRLPADQPELELAQKIPSGSHDELWPETSFGKSSTLDGGTSMLSNWNMTENRPNSVIRGSLDSTPSCGTSLLHWDMPSLCNSGFDEMRSGHNHVDDDRRRSNSVSFGGGGLLHSDMTSQFDSTPLKSPNFSQMHPLLFGSNAFSYHEGEMVEETTARRSPYLSGRYPMRDVSCITSNNVDMSATLSGGVDVRTESGFDCTSQRSAANSEYYANNAYSYGSEGRSRTQSASSGVGSAMNPNCAEFVPSRLVSSSSPPQTLGSTRGEGTMKQKEKGRRDSIEEELLMKRIEENGILVLKLRGLPYSATGDDIAAFFEPLVIPRDSENHPTVVIGQDILQRPSGEAFVTFATVSDCQEGLKYHMRHLGKRYIEIFPLFNKDYYRKNAIYCNVCNKYGHTSDVCVLRFKTG